MPKERLAEALVNQACQCHQLMQSNKGTSDGDLIANPLSNIAFAAAAASTMAETDFRRIVQLAVNTKFEDMIFDLDRALTVLKQVSGGGEAGSRWTDTLQPGVDIIEHFKLTLMLIDSSQIMDPLSRTEEASNHSNRFA